MNMLYPDPPPLVSIIVPVYNVREHLESCLASLSAVRYPRKEIILVDDASTDGSGGLCDEYCEANDFAVVIHFPVNQGVSFARAEGLENARGDYVVFADADDHVHPDLLDRMMEAALAHGADLVCSQIWHVRNGTKKVEIASIFGVIEKADIDRHLRSDLVHNFKFGNPGMPLVIYGKLYRKEVIVPCIRVGLGLRYGEDTITVLACLLTQVQKMVCLDDPLYYYVHHASQITARHQSFIWPLFIPYYERLDELGGEVFFRQLVPRIWNRIKPGLYDHWRNWGGLVFDNRFVRMNRAFRNTPVLKKYLWDNPDVPAFIRKKPHFFLMKHRLYWLDYLLYLILWRIN